MSAQYRATVPYHNFRHACDVLHATYLLLTLVEAEKLLNDIERLALALAALCHDVDHPGLTNAFLVNCNDPLAIRYNDISVLENHHASTAIKTLLAYESMNILSNLKDEEQRQVRKLMVEIILATDMGQHPDILDSLKVRINDSRPFECSRAYIPQTEDSDCLAELSVSVPPSTKDALLLMRMIIKCADISNVMKPFILSKRWAALLLIEWFRQGDLERRLGMPVSKNMDRDNPSALQSMSIGCIDYVGKEMYEMTTVLLPKLQDDVLPNLWANRSDWLIFSQAGSSSQEVAEEILSTFNSGLILKNQIQVTTARQSVSGSNSALPQSSMCPHVAMAPTAINDRPLSLLSGGPMQQRPVSVLPPDLSRHTSVPDVNLPKVTALDESPSNRVSAVHIFEPLKGPGNFNELQPATELPRSSVFGSIRRSTIFQRIAERSSIDVSLKLQPTFWKMVRSHPYAVNANRLLDSRIWQCIIVPISCIALFADDLIKASLPKAADPYIVYIYLLCLALFLLELILLSVVRDRYFAGISFWLDLLGSLSLVPLILGKIKANLLIARSIKTAKTFTRAAKWMQTEGYMKLFQFSNVLRVLSHIKIDNRILHG